MPLQLVTAGEADALRIAELECDAFAGSPISPVLFPGPHPANSLELRAAQMAEFLRANPHTVHWLKVVDTDLAHDAENQQLVAFAQWHVYHPDPAPPVERQTFGPGSDPEACHDFFSTIWDTRERVMGGKTYVYLKYLTTDPKHQRRGAGRMLMKWGIDEADRLGLPVWLEASPEGKKLYESCGLKVVETLEMDLSKYGKTGVHPTCAMRRNPSN